MKIRCCLLLFLWPLFAFGQATPTVKQAPPPGIAVPPQDAAEIKSSLEQLRAEIESLRKIPAALSLLQDIEVFHKAVRYALEYDEFFRPDEISAAKSQLALATQRAIELRAGKPSWTSATGPIVRGYKSIIDASVQPYGLIVPADWKPEEKKPRPLYLWFHGRGDTLSEVSFIAGRLKGKREFAPANAFELHLYGRYCNASKFAGEMDAFEAMADVMRQYPIDTNRIADLGFSMGGATAWHMAAHFPGSWAVASPGAGFAETAVYAKVFNDKSDLPKPWEQTLWKWYDATAYAANFANLPVIAYSGEIDPQKQSAEIMEKALAVEGLKLERLIGPNTAHKYEPETKKELSRRIDARMDEGSNPFPDDVRFVTYTLRYNRMKWITLDRLEKHWERAEIKAHATPNEIRIETTNISAFTLTLPPAPKARAVVIDGQRVKQGDHFSKLKGKWQGQSGTRWNESLPNFGKGLHKVHGLTGPIDDAFMDSFVFVRPTGKPLNEQVGAWAASEMDRAITEWRRNFRGDVRIKEDRALTDDDISSCNLVLWGDPGSNATLARILPKLSITWTKQQLICSSASDAVARRLDPSQFAPILIFPNPLNPKRYVVLNSGFTFRQGSATSNSLQTPKLPDWAVVDLRTPPDLKWPGRIVAAGFFDDQWRMPVE